MKKNIDRKYNILIYALFTMVLLIIHCFIVTGSNDDAWFSQVLDNYSLVDYLSMRYVKWTSRLPIETAMVFLTRMNPWLWKLINIAVILLLVYECSLIFGRGNKVLDTVGFMFLVLLIPFDMLNSAGWIATTINYLWPITFGILAILPLYRWESGERIRKWEYLVCSLAGLFACFQEQVAAVLFVVYVIYAGYRVYNKQKVPLYWYTLFLISAFLLIFILTCPGNENRSILETETWFPEFADLSYAQKLLIGYLNTFSYFISCGDFNMVFVLFSYVLFLAVFFSKKSIVLRLTALYPFVISFVWGYIGRTIMSWNVTTRIYWMGLIQNDKLPEYGVYSSEHIFIECLVFLSVLCAVIVSLLAALGKTTEFCVAFITLSAGLCSRIILGFSPTVYTSGARTATLGYICFLILIFVCMQKGLLFKRFKKYILYYIPCYMFSLVITIVNQLEYMN